MRPARPRHAARSVGPRTRNDPAPLTSMPPSTWPRLPQPRSGPWSGPRRTATPGWPTRRKPGRVPTAQRHNWQPRASRTAPPTPSKPQPRRGRGTQHQLRPKCPSQKLRNDPVVRCDILGSGGNAMNALAHSYLFWIVLILGLLGLSILRSVITATRGVEGLGWIIVINLLPTGVGWLAALIGALLLPRREQPAPPPPLRHVAGGYMATE